MRSSGGSGRGSRSRRSRSPLASCPTSSCASPVPVIDAEGERHHGPDAQARRAARPGRTRRVRRAAGRPGRRARPRRLPAALRRLRAVRDRAGRGARQRARRSSRPRRAGPRRSSIRPAAGTTCPVTHLARPTGSSRSSATRRCRSIPRGCRRGSPPRSRPLPAARRYARAHRAGRPLSTESAAVP